MPKKGVTIEIDTRVWETTKGRARVAGVFVSRWVEEALTAYEGAETSRVRSREVLSATPKMSGVEALRASGLLSTGRELVTEPEELEEGEVLDSVTGEIRQMTPVEVARWRETHRGTFDDT